MKKTLKILGLLVILSTILGIMLLGDNLSTTKILLIEFGLAFLGIPLLISLVKDWSKKEPDYIYKVKVEMDQQRQDLKLFKPISNEEWNEIHKSNSEYLSYIIFDYPPGMNMF